MPDITLALLVFLFPLAFSPGPGNLFFAALGARGGGLAATGPAMLGYHAATWAVAVAVGLGAAEIVQASPGAAQALRIAGGLYLLVLAHRLWRAAPLRLSASSARHGVMTGAALLVLNPKAYVIVALMFAQFPEAAQGPGGVVWIATVFTLNNLAAFTLWTLAGTRLAAVCGDGPGARRLNAGLAACLAGVAVWMLVA